MPDSSLPPYSNNPSGLPEKFSFKISREEASEVRAMARRFAPEIRNGYRVQVQFGATKRTWAMWEQNVVGYLTFPDFEPLQRGWFSLSINCVEFITDLCERESEVEVTTDFSSNTCTVASSSTSFTLELPVQKQMKFDIAICNDAVITTSARDIANMGRILDMYPLVIDPETMPWHVPFVEFTFDGNQLTAKRDWSVFKAGVVSVSIPATGVSPHHFSCFPVTLPREMYFADLYDSDEVSLVFSEASPHLMVMKGANWGLRVEMGDETTYKNRKAIELQLSSNEIDVAIDDRIGWNPIIECSFDGAPVVIEIIKGKGLGGTSDFIRMSHVVLNDAPWNFEVASEVNEWNSSWNSVKLVYNDGALRVTREMHADDVDSMSDAVVDLVQKARIVSEIVGVFI